jgi:acyl-ACP thioesterase
MPGTLETTNSREVPPDSSDVELPSRGRVVESRRMVRTADVGPDRRARLDTLARYLHDAAEDDAASATLPRSIGWILRRTRLEVRAFPTLGEDLVLETFCSATASRWAERTTLVKGTNGARVSAASIWVAVDVVTGAPARLGEWFFRLYAPSAAGRRASAKLTLDAPPAHVLGAARPWPLRRTDFDAWGHVNNAIAWAALEDAVELGRPDALTALVEHRAPIAPGTTPLLVTDQVADRWSVWLVDAATPGHDLMAAALEVRRAGSAGPLR